MKKLLIVEDDPRIVRFYQDCLKSDFDVSEYAVSGQEAIEKAARNKPDLIIMDINLSGDMDGINAARHIHTISDVPVLFVTSSNDTETLQRAKLIKPIGYLLKPVDADVLGLNIEVALHMYNTIKPSGVNSFSEAYIGSEKAIIHSEAQPGLKRIEIVNNRFMKQYWIMETDN